MRSQSCFGSFLECTTLRYMDDPHVSWIKSGPVLAVAGSSIGTRRIGECVTSVTGMFSQSGVCIPALSSAPLVVYQALTDE